MNYPFAGQNIQHRVQHLLYFQQSTVLTDVWLGLTLEGSSFKWSSTGATLDSQFTNWRTGEPNNVHNDDQPDGEKCVVMHVENGQWIDVPCTWTVATMCEKIIS